MTILISGGTGFIGQALVKKMKERGDVAILLTRDPERLKRRFPSSVEIVRWDGMSPGDWCSIVERANAVVNLAGESIGDHRWSRRQKELIVGSRVNATRAIVQAIASAQKKPEVFVNASAVGFYGSTGEDVVTEDRGRGEGFLAETCARWEAEAAPAKTYCSRIVILRMGVVMGERGGALDKMLIPFKLFVGGPLGSGLQWFPWVHLDDLISAILFVLDNPRLIGPVNIAAPQAVRMKEFCSQLGNALGRPSWLPVPAFALRTLLGELSTMVLTGQRVVPAQLTNAGFVFRFPDLFSALQDLFGR